MMARWSEENSIKFVEQYIKYECLWNPAIAEYKNKQKRQLAYAEISEKMGIDGFGPKDVIQKIKNIRSTYSQELKKIKDSEKSGAGTDDIYVPSLKWFKILEETLKSVSASCSRQTQANTDTEIESEATSTTTAASNQTPALTSATTACNKTPTSSQVPPKRKRVQELHGVLDQLQGISDCLNKTNNAEEHEFDIFGCLIGKQLKSLPLVIALEAQQHIQTYLNQKRLQTLNPGADISQRPSSATSAYSTYSYNSPSDCYSSLPSVGTSLDLHTDYSQIDQAASTASTTILQDAYNSAIIDL